MPQTCTSRNMIIPRLPLETTEHILGFLCDDMPTLTRCALLCHTVLPTCRRHIWRKVSLPVVCITDRSRWIYIPEDQQITSQLPSMTRFLAAIDSNPDLASYVRSLTLEWRVPHDGVPMPDWDTVKVWDKLPNLRALTFRRMVFPSLHILLPLSKALSLETLVLEDVFCALSLSDILNPKPPAPADSVSTSCHGASTLKCLSIRGNDEDSIVELVDALVEQNMHVSLQELALGWDSYVMRETNAEVIRASARVYASLGTQLRRCGVQVPAAAKDPSDIYATLDSLRPCGALKLLSIRAPRLTVASSNGRPFTFLEALAKLLASSDSPPFPQLEELTIYWSRSTDEFPGGADACALIRDALLPETNRKQYPFLRLLKVHSHMDGFWSDSYRRRVSPEEIREAVRAEEVMLNKGLGAIRAAGTRLEVVVTVASH
ncbi:hypothetical protein C8Q76DRAFT_753750 [Earliella scabrosa]|nr:hypothetical protein C8Q76DRAFT_753750 [Earliella scabrosa]